MEKTGLIHRYSNIDRMEVLAIFSVVLYHGFIIPYGILENKTMITYINYFVKSFLVIGVPIFFFCNGYLLFGKKLDLRKHCKTIGKYIGLCIAWELISMACFACLGIIKLNELNLMYTLIDASGYFAHFWFIGALVCIYLLYPLLKIVYDKNKNVFCFFVLVCFTLTFGNKIITFFVNILRYYRELPISFDNYFGMFNLFRGIHGYTIVYFCVGGIVKWIEEKYEEYICAHNIKILSVVILFFSTILLFLYGIFYSRMRGSVWDVVAESYDTIFALINTLCIYWLLVPYKDCANKGIEIVASNTLGIYYLHMIFIHLSQKYLSYNRVYNIIDNTIYAILIIAVSLVVSIIIKKCPIVKRLL